VGKGTLSADGVGLLASLLQHYASQPCPPLLLACTHFSELLDPGGVLAGAIFMEGVLQVDTFTAEQYSPQFVKKTGLHNQHQHTHAC
jgi:hypothetical protein